MINKEIIFKYILQFLIILLILRLIPNSSTFDKLIITSIVIVLFYLFDVKVLTIEKLTNEIKPELNEEQKKELEIKMEQAKLENEILQKKIKDITAELEKKPAEQKHSIDLNQLSRAEQEIIADEMKYNDINHLFVDEDYKTPVEDIGSEVFIPPEKWWGNNISGSTFPPICVTNKRCTVCPSLTSGAPIDLKEWHESRRVTAPDKINVEYINEKLNSGL